MGAIARMLADDLLLLVRGSRALYGFAHIFHLTMVHLDDLGGRIAPHKSKIFATLGEHRAWLATYMWPTVGTNIDVVHHMRDLGAYLSCTLVSSTTLSRQRLHSATQILMRIAHLPFTMEHKARFAFICAHTRGLYGCEASPVDESALKHYSSTLLRVVGSKCQMHARSLTFEFSGGPRNLDPYVEIFTRRVMMLRRVWIKLPWTRTQVTQIY